MKSLVTLAATLALATTAPAAELFVAVHSGSPMAQGAAMVLATQAQQQQAQVRVLLCDAAGDIAVNGVESPSLKPRNP